MRRAPRAAAMRHNAPAVADVVLQLLLRRLALGIEWVVGCGWWASEPSCAVAGGANDRESDEPARMT